VKRKEKKRKEKKGKERKEERGDGVVKQPTSNYRKN
jgi:hypothetical protein